MIETIYTSYTHLAILISLAYASLHKAVRDEKDCRCGCVFEIGEREKRW